jgi:hypothetical protein
MAARLDEDGRCVLTECWPGECGCPDHRGGEVIDLATSEHVDKVITAFTSQPFVARFPGRCVSCGSGFGEAATVRYDQDHELVAECCLELPDRHRSGGYWTEGN